MRAESCSRSPGGERCPVRHLLPSRLLQQHQHGEASSPNKWTGPLLQAQRVLGNREWRPSGQLHWQMCRPKSQALTFLSGNICPKTLAEAKNLTLAEVSLLLKLGPDKGNDGPPECY